MIDEPIAGFWLVLASKLSSADKALARSVAANQVPIGPNCGIDGLGLKSHTKIPVAPEFIASRTYNMRRILIGHADMGPQSE
jgi:hypothetical protein